MFRWPFLSQFKLYRQYQLQIDTLQGEIILIRVRLVRSVRMSGSPDQGPTGTSNNVSKWHHDHRVPVWYGRGSARLCPSI